MSNTPSTFKGFPNGLVSRNLPVLDSYPGKIFWVDSVNGSNGNKATFRRSLATLAYLYDNATALNFVAGDKVYCKNGHVEPVIAAAGLDLDVAGTMIVFMGEGSNRAQINFTTAVSADMDIDAANITLVNPLFVAGIDALTGPIDVNAADFTMIGAEYRDAVGIDTTDAIVADAAADRMVIDGYRYVRGDEAGTQKQSHMQIAAATDCKLNNIDITGDFGTGIIENGTAWVDANLTNLLLNNTSSTPTVCVLLQATSTGWVADSGLRVASGTVGVTANNNMQFDDVGVVGVDGSASVPVGTAAVSALISDSVSIGSDAVMVNGDTLFTIAGGPIEILALVSQCITNNDGTASTLQYNCTATLGGAITFSGASASLASATAGESVVLNATALTTAPDVTVAGLVALTGVHTRGILADSGIITAVVGVGSTTGTWRHHLRWRPLAPGVTVVGT